MDAGKRPSGRTGTSDLRLLAACYTAGVLAVHALRELPSPLFLALAALPLLWPWRARAAWCALLLGALVTTWQAQRQLEQRWPETRHNQEVLVRGHIASLPELKIISGREGGGRTEAWRFRFDADAGQAIPPARVSWYRSDETLRGGECWQLRLRLKTPHGSLNPGGFDYEAWLFRQGIGATATVKSGERCETDEGGYAVLKLRQRIVEALRIWLPQHPAQPLVAALAVGDDSGLSDSDWEVFRATGTAHLVAISGFNIGLIAGAAFFLFRWLWSLWPALCLRLPAQKAGMLGAALLAIFYSLLAGFEPPVLRALLMLLLILVAAWLHRLSQPSRLLALAWLTILLVDPFAVMSPGLWLSFGAVAAIFYVSAQRLSRPGLLKSLVLIQLMLSLLLAPLTLYFFQGISGSGPLVNLIAVPFFAVLTPLLLGALLLCAAWPFAGLPLLNLVADALQWFRLGLDVAAAQPQLWLAASPPPGALLLAGFGILLLFAPGRLPLRLPGLLCLLPLLFPPSQSPPRGVEVTALDVGQGLAVVLRTAKHSLLFDAGPAFEEGFDAGEAVVAPFLLSRDVHELDALMLSHDDNDHTGGAEAVGRLLRVSQRLGVDGAACRDGARWEWDDVRFELLHPDTGQWKDNDRSCVLRVETGGQVLLLTGDIEKKAEARLLREHAERLKASVLFAAHHGGKTSSSEAFVTAVAPQLVIYSAGWRHHFGHPNPVVVERFEAVNARQYVTGKLGALRFTLGGNAMLPVESYRETAARWWNAAAEPLLP